MANVDLNVNTGETKTLTFNTKDKYNTEDIIFNITANGSGGNDTTTFMSGTATYSNGSLVCNVTNVPSGRRSYTDATGVAVGGIAFVFNGRTNLMNEHYLLIKTGSSQVNLGNINFSAGTGVTLLKPIDLANITVAANKYIELSFLPISKTKVIMTISEILN